MRKSRSTVRLPVLKILILVIVIFTGSFLAIWYQRTMSLLQSNQSPITPNNPVVAESIAATEHETEEVHSPDGTLKLLMRAENKKNNVKLYTFSVSDISGKNEHPIFTKTVDATANMVIPENSWSPDNKYVFVQEVKNGSVSDTLVAKSSGDAFSDGQQLLDVTSLFTQKNIQHAYTDATGWAAPTLLIVTTSDQNTKGPSYWFEVDSTSFIQLAGH